MGQHVKEVYYFSHDSNARNDPKICKLRMGHGLEGYAIYWMIIEMLREQTCYKLNISDYDAIAMQAQCEPEKVQSIIKDCIEKYGLFECDVDDNFWSNSLIKRMEQKEEKSEKARQAALSRWKDNNDDTDAMRTQCERNASKVKESKESKVKESKKEYAPAVTMKEEEYQKLIDKFGEQDTKDRIERLSLYKKSKGKKYKCDYSTILAWARSDDKRDPPRKVKTGDDVERDRQRRLKEAGFA